MRMERVVEALAGDTQASAQPSRETDTDAPVSWPSYLSQYYSGFNVFQYLTLRAILGVLTALVISFLVGPEMIRRLGRYQIGQTVRNDGPQTHLVKAGTPTMGGALILVAVAIATLLWADLANRYVWVVLLVTLPFGAIGWVDDYKKLVLKNSAGSRPRVQVWSGSR